MKLNCCVVRDLLPLYVENMVSEQTAELIRQHLTECPDCQNEYESFNDSGRLDVLETPLNSAPAEGKSFKKLMQKLNRQLHGFAYGLIIFFILWGFSLTGGEDLMYNNVIMPIVGVFGYYVFRCKALYKMPILLLVLNLLFYSSVFPWTVIYSIFVVVGVLIAFLLHFAFRKEPKE